jgi:hypothetical protein
MSRTASPGGHGVHVARRHGRLTFGFRSEVVEAAPAHAGIRVETSDLRLTVRGTLSSGSIGWVLAGRASSHRRTITVEIMASRGRDRPVAGVEDHAYEAVIGGAGPGRYLLRVKHVWLLSRERGEMLVMPAYEGAITFIPRPS